MLAIPALDKSITMSVKLNDLEEKWLPDLKIPRQASSLFVLISLNRYLMALVCSVYNHGTN
jgi:hypothetical protein